MRVPPLLEWIAVVIKHCVRPPPPPPPPPPPAARWCIRRVGRFELTHICGLEEARAFLFPPPLPQSHMF